MKVIFYSSKKSSVWQDEAYCNENMFVPVQSDHAVLPVIFHHLLLLLGRHLGCLRVRGPGLGLRVGVGEVEGVHLLGGGGGGGHGHLLQLARRQRVPGAVVVQHDLVLVLGQPRGPGDRLIKP